MKIAESATGPPQDLKELQPAFS